MAKLDFEFEIRHMFYCFTVAIVWLALTFWGDRLFDNLYFEAIPQIANTFIIISYIFGFLMLGFSVFVLVDALQIVN